MIRTPLEHLRRRKLFQWGFAYVAASWVLVQVLDVVAEPWGISGGLIRGIQAVLALALPAVLVLAWYHGEKGHQRVTRPEAAILTSIVLLAAVVLVVWDPFQEPPPAPAGVATASVDPSSLLVLPFANMSSDPEQEYMSDGIAEELLNLLAKIPELRVVSRTTAFSFKGRDDITLREIAAQLGVAHVLEGSVRTSGNTIRITAQLIDARSDTHLFSEAYDRTLDDVFAIQDEIAGRVVDELKIVLLGEIPQLLETDPEAYTLFLRARHIAQVAPYGVVQSLDSAVMMLRRAVEIDPGYAPAHLDLGRAYSNQVELGNLPFEEGTRMAMGAIEHALSLDPDNARAKASLGLELIWHLGDIAEGARQIEVALASGHPDAEALMAAGIALSLLGRFDEAIPVFEYAADLDPLHLPTLGNLAITYYYAGRWAELAAAARAILVVNPSAVQAHSLLGMALLHTGDLEGALAEIEEEPYVQQRLFGLAVVHHALGRESDFEASLQELLALVGSGEAPPGSPVAVYAYAGDVEAAFALLEELPIDITVVADPMLANLRGDPRWEEVLSRLDPSLEERAAIRLQVRLPR